MPIKPKRVCTYAGCSQFTTDRYCSTHAHMLQDKRKQYDKQRPAYHAWYSTARWRVLRIKYLSMNPLCVLCKADGRLTPATVVDHKTPHKGNKGLFYDVDNFQALCKQCHDSKTAKEDGGFSNKIRV